MSKVIYSDKTIHLNRCDVWLSGCTLNMKHCKVITRVCDIDECSRIKVENESLKSQVKSFADEFQAKDDKIRDLEDHCCDLDILIADLQAKIAKLQEENDKLREKSSNSTTDQLSKTLGSVDSEENAKLRVKPRGEGTF